MPRKRKQPERKLSPRHEFLSLFFGQVISTDTLDIVETGPSVEVSANFGIATREKSLGLHPHEGAPASVHIVNLSSPPACSTPVRRPFDFSQKCAIFAHRLRGIARRPNADDYARMDPHVRFVTGGSLTEFLALPFLFAKSLLQKPRKATAPSALIQKSQSMAPRRYIASMEIPRAKDIRREKQAGSAKPRTAFFIIPEGWRGSLVSFAVIGAAVILPVFMLAAFSGILGDIDFAQAQTTIALDGLKSAGKQAVAFDAHASAGFEQAAGHFADTRTRLTNATLRIGALITGNGGKLSAGAKLLDAGEEFSLAGVIMTTAFNALEDEPDTNTSSKIGRLLTAFGEALPHIDSGITTLESVPERSIPESYRTSFTQTLEEMHALREHAEAVTASSDTVLSILGTRTKRRYLVIFQNDHELRPTGGFIGSYALMDIKDGQIVNTEIPAGGSYDLRGGLTERIAAPEQLRLVNPRWEFQDANWFADFPSSARTLTWFYEKSGGPTIDGIIAVTSSFMEELLDVIGPVDIEPYGKTITAENFFIETQKAVEIEYDPATNAPKQFISDMAPLVLERLVNLEGEGLLPLVGAVSHAVSAKHLMVYFRDDVEQALASDFGWAGEMKSIDGADFLAIIDTNIAGGKTDGVVYSDIQHEMRVGEDGSLIDTVTVRRTHHGQEGELFTGIKNIDFMRVYVPHDSVLLSAEGFERPGDGYFLETDETLEASTMLAAVEGRRHVDENSGTLITEESGFTVFGNWIQLEPGESRAVRLTYRLPFTLDDLSKKPDTLSDRLKDAIGAFTSTAGVKLVVHSQPGAVNRTISSTIRFPNGWSVRSRIPEQATYHDGMLSYEGALDRDLFIGSVLTKTD